MTRQFNGSPATKSDPSVRSVSWFQVCAGVGLVTCLALSMVLTVCQELSVHVTVVLACAGLLAFLVLTMITKVIMGEEVLIYYHDEIAVLVTAAAVLYTTGLPVLPYLDVSVLAVGTLLAFGRLGCFMVGCCHGRPSQWGVRYRHEHADAGFPRYLVGVRLFPVPLVESAWAFCTVGWGVWLVVAKAPPGEALAWYTTVYGVGRFLFEFLRGDVGRPHFGRFSEAQWTSLLLMTANATAEIAGLLPLHGWHVAVTAALATTVIALSLASDREERLFRPQHIREMAELIEAARAWTAETGVLHLGRSSLGIQLSASTVRDGPQKVDVIAFSSSGAALSERAARRIGRLIGRLRDCPRPAQLLKGDLGVYKLVVPSLRPAHAL